MRLLVTVTNADGVASRRARATAKVVSAPPVNTVRPTITGTAQRGQTLIGTLGTWTGIDNVYDHQWQRSVNGTTWTNIAGATRPSYDLTVADVGSIVRLLVTATNPDGDRSPPPAPRPRRPERAAGQHRPPDGHRHRPPRRRAHRHRRHLERDRQRLGLPVAALERQRHDVAEHRRRDQTDVRARPTPTSARSCACCVTATNPEGSATETSLPTAVGGRRRPGQHDRARDHRHRAPRVDLDGASPAPGAASATATRTSGSAPPTARTWSNIAGATSAVVSSSTDGRRRRDAARARDRHQPGRRRAAARAPRPRPCRPRRPSTPACRP